jgi:hypothetical protein
MYDIFIEDETEKLAEAIKLLANPSEQTSDHRENHGKP